MPGSLTRANTLNVHAARWLAAAKRQGFVERVDDARYQVRKEVPTL